MARRRLTVFSLSFLDVMSCGFGAVVLIFLIINHSTQEAAKTVNQDMLSEVRLLDYQVQQGEKDLFEKRQQLDDIRQRVADADRQLTSTEQTLDNRRQDLDELSAESLALLASLQKLKSDVDTREEDVERLRELAQANDGTQARSFVGDGDRQYLTGLRVGGSHILIALDTSASMLDRTIVNVIRRRNMSADQQRSAPKWQRAVRTVEWLVAQLPLDAQFQILGFGEATKPLGGAAAEWQSVGDPSALDRAITAVNELVPAGGSSLERLMLQIRNMNPLPDNVYLIIDSLPTMGDRAPRQATISGSDRLDLYRDAVNKLPAQVPMNVIMFPMEGDPMASAAYWNLARNTGGAFISPSRDWP